MRTHNFKKDIDCRMFCGLVIGMALLLTTIVYDAFGSGPTCASPCAIYSFDYCTGSWGCQGCDSCSHCNTSTATCVYDCRPICMDCNSIANPSGCGGIITGCTSNLCSPEKCETCDGHGLCKVCGGDPNKACCNGTCYNTTTQSCCNGEIYDKSTQKCCPGLFGTEFICDINSNCCDYLCCDPKECKTCGSPSPSSCKVCDDNPNQKCCSGVCKEKCKIINYGSCTGTDEICEACSVTGCTMGSKIYAGGNGTVCNPNGCTGDCHEALKVCYTEYPCIPDPMPLPTSYCSGYCLDSEGIPYPCPIHCEVTLTIVNCYICDRDTYHPDEHKVPNDSCGS